MPNWSSKAGDYLNFNEQRIQQGKMPVTPGTYLSRVLRGRSLSWKMRYQEALIRALTEENSPYKAVEVRSKCGKVAYIRPQKS